MKPSIQQEQTEQTETDAPLPLLPPVQIQKAKRQRFAALVLASGLAAGLLSAPSVQAQSEESEPAPALGEFEAAPLPPPDQPFLVPDVPQSFVDQTQVRQRWITLKTGVVVLADYTAFNQDPASVGQVGRQHDQWEARAARLMFRGTIGTDYKISYLVAGEYKGFESDPGELWQLTDVSLTFPLGGPANKLTVGKTKETFAYEMVGDAANLPQQERILTPFFVSRNIGLKLNHVLGAAQRMTLSYGIFNDWWVTDNSAANNGTDVTARFTGLVWDQPDGKRFLHLGVSGRYAGADNNTMRYAGRPESNVADNYVDTGNLTGDHAVHLGLEALWNEGPFSVLGEYNRAWVDSHPAGSQPVMVSAALPYHAAVDSATSGNPQFYGYYLTASWILTGETRPYDRTVGYARRVMPAGRWGAPELVARFSHEDFDDAYVSGGTMDKTYLGINWWATRRWKLGFGWGHTWLDRFGTTGNTDSFQTRIQWIY